MAPDATVKKYLTVRMEGKREVKRLLDYYNLDMIISVGYRVKSQIETQFRIWATQQLREYIVKGFTMDDERLKAAGLSVVHFPLPDDFKEADACGDRDVEALHKTSHLKREQEIAFVLG